jgi:hypothetical protein
MTDPSNISLKLYARPMSAWWGDSTLLDYKQGYYGSLLAVSDEVAIVRFTGAGLTAL